MSSIRTTAAGQEHADGQSIGIAGEKLGFLGATPVVQRVGAAQTAITDNSGGSTANATVAVYNASACAGGATPTAAQVDTAIASGMALAAAGTAKTLVLLNEIRAALVVAGLIKGAA